MALVSDIVSAALRKIRVVDSDSIPSASEMRDGLDALNRMMIRWEADGISLGYSPVTTSTDTVHVPPEAENAVIYNLGASLTDEFGVELAPSLATFASEYKAALCRDMLNQAPLRSRSRTPWAEAVQGVYDIYTDSYK